MQKINTRRIIYHIRHRYLTLNNIVIAVAFLIAASWVWGALSATERNFRLQKEVDYKNQLLLVTQLETDNLALQKRYYQTAEYQELAARESLALALPGERQLILPPNTQAAIDANKIEVASRPDPSQASNIEQWINFLFGGYSRSIQGDE